MTREKFRIAFFDAKPYDRRFFDEANRPYGFTIVYFEEKLSARTASLAAGFDAVCAFVNDELGEAAVNRLTEGGVGIIAMRCAGYNNVNLKAACANGIPVVRVPRYSPYAVAEYALGLLLTLNRRIHRAYNRVREGNFSINGLIGFDLHGKTVGVIGTGKIGMTFAGLLRGFGVRLLGYDLYPNQEEAAKIPLEYVPLEQLLRESDVVSLHCPLTPENTRLIDRERIGLMKPGVFLLNTSRGKLIDTAALIEGLKSGRIGGAGLDVYEEETEYFFEDRSDRVMTDDLLARLMTFPNVIVSSHQAFFTREAETAIAEVTLASLAAFMEGERLENAVGLDCDGGRACPGKRRGERCAPKPGAKGKE